MSRPKPPDLEHAAALEAPCPEGGGPSLSWRVRPIGVIRAPFSTPVEAPRHFKRIGRSTVHVFPDYVSGLKDLEGFSHLWLIVLLHRSDGFDLLVKPKERDMEHGVFATRSPRRPNPLGLTLVELVKREGGDLHVLGADLCDHTPLLDIKPYLPSHDCAESPRLGWWQEEQS